MGLSLARGLTSLWVAGEAHQRGVHWEGRRNGLGRMRPSPSLSEASLGNVGVRVSREESGADTRRGHVASLGGHLCLARVTEELRLGIISKLYRKAGKIVQSPNSPPPLPD